jgi:hypothetical protein
VRTDSTKTSLQFWKSYLLVQPCPLCAKIGRAPKSIYSSSVTESESSCAPHEHLQPIPVVSLEERPAGHRCRVAELPTELVGLAWKGTITCSPCSTPSFTRCSGRILSNSDSSIRSPCNNGPADSRGTILRQIRFKRNSGSLHYQNLNRRRNPQKGENCCQIVRVRRCYLLSICSKKNSRPPLAAPS